MAEISQPPPGKIISFCPYGEWGKMRLYLLPDPTSFQCANCGLMKSENRLAIAFKSKDKSRSRQILCSVCYYKLAHGELIERARIKVPEVPRQKTGKKSGRQPSQPKPPRVKPPARQAASAEQAPTEQAPANWLPTGAHRVYDFFHTARIRIEVTLDQRILIKGKLAGRLSDIAPPWTPQWEEFVNQLSWGFAYDEFAKSIETNARLDAMFKAIPSPGNKCFVIMNDHEQVATIRATAAVISGHPPIYGNFLLPGPHWMQLKEVILHPEKNDAAQGARLIDRFPANFPQEIANECLEASRRIRMDRQVAYENPLVLECATGVLRLHPITGAPPQLHIPFHFRTTVSVFGELILRNQDPLPMLVKNEIHIEDAITAWVHALLGFADATCIEVQPTTSHGRARLPRPRPAATVPRPRTSTRSVPRRPPWPGQLEPIGSWFRHGASFVAGHRRHLGEGQTASDQAIERAHQVGIVLDLHETWVRPHTRGIPNHAEMRFRWHTHIELKQLARRHS